MMARPEGGPPITALALLATRQDEFPARWPRPSGRFGRAPRPLTWLADYPGSGHRKNRRSGKVKDTAP